MKKIICAVLILSMVLASVSVSFAAQKKYIALTFDDGPGPYTGQILDTLKKKNAKATFFVLGTRAEKYPNLIKRMYDEGHQIGLHSYNHPNFVEIKAETQKWQIAQSIDAVNNAIGTRLSDYVFRPPYGNSNNSVRKNIEMPFITWTVDSKDWDNHDAEITYSNIIKSAFDGAIVLQHDIQLCSAQALGKVIDTLRSRGYEFVTVDELFYQKGCMPQDGTVYGSVKGPNLFSDANCLELNGVKVKDIALDAWYLSAATDMLEKEYMSLDNNLFYANRAMKRLDIVELLYKAAGSPQPETNLSFTDIKENAAVSWAAGVGITKGYPDGSFRPNSRVSRQDFACFFMRYDEWRSALAEMTSEATITDLAKPEVSDDEIIDYSCLDRFQDSSSISNYATDAVAQMVKKGLLTGDNRGMLMPMDFISKAQAATVLNRMN